MPTFCFIHKMTDTGVKRDTAPLGQCSEKTE